MYIEIYILKEFFALLMCFNIVAISLFCLVLQKTKD